MLKAVTIAAVLAVAAIPCARIADAQQTAPGPTNPTPAPNPLAKPGTDLVINPTNEECQKGWRPGLKWTKEQFETFCTQMKTSK